MKELLLLLAALSLLPISTVLAQDGHDRGQGGGGSSWDGGSGPHKGSRGSGGKKSSPVNKRAFNNHNPGPRSFNPGQHQFQRKRGGFNRQPGSFQNSNRGQGQIAHPQNFNRSAQAPARLRKMGITHIPQPIRDKRQILSANPQHSAFAPPQKGPSGESLHASVLKPTGAGKLAIQTHMTSIAHNATFTAQVNVYNTQETRVNHYYWHTWNGMNYCHYYDNWGYHWYGWYWGGNCFWTRWYANNWWWYDPVAFRWCYWYDGGWWWQDPYHVNVVYVYNGSQYVPATNSGEAVQAPSQGPEVLFRSNDGTRMVKVVGGDAFLYDTAEGETENKPLYLGSNVKEVKFAKPGFGRSPQILVIYNDGSFEMFDWEGNSLQNQPTGDPSDENSPAGDSAYQNDPAENPPAENPPAQNLPEKNPPPPPSGDGT